MMWPPSAGSVQGGPFRPLGRPRRERPLSEHSLWPLVLAALQAGHLNRAEAARKLRVRRATLDDALWAVRNGGASELGGD